MLGVPIRSRYTDTYSGYVQLYLVDGSVVDEHRYVMTQEMGRELLHDEVVHHKDENKQNNEPDNLEIRDDSDHKAEHSSRTHDEKHTVLICPMCEKEFELLNRVINIRKKSGQKEICCSLSCGRRHQHQETKKRKERNKKRREKYRENKKLKE